MQENEQQHVSKALPVRPESSPPFVVANTFDG